jgi:protease-4
MFKDKVLASLLLGLGLFGIILSLFPNVSKDNSVGANSSTAKSLGIAGDKILVLNLNGVLMDGTVQSVFGSESSVAVKARDQLIKAAKEKSVKGVLIRINSPGGAVGISQEVYQAVKKVRAKKPVVVSMGDVAASGGYYIAAASDYIFANPGTLTGSIGVISHFMNTEGLYSKVGLKDMTIKSGRYKDIGSSSRPMSEEEKEILQNLVDDTYNQFIDDVYEGRRSNSNEYGSLRKNLTRGYVQEVAQGMIYTGRQAKEIGLVDKLGNYNDALEELQKLIQKRSGGRIKDDLPTTESLNVTGSLKELISMSSLLGNRQQSKLPYNSVTSSAELPTDDLFRLFKIKNPILFLAPEFI